MPWMHQTNGLNTCKKTNPSQTCKYVLVDLTDNEKVLIYSYQPCGAATNKEPINTLRFHLLGLLRDHLNTTWSHFKRVRQGLFNQLSEWRVCVLTWVLCVPSYVVMDELKTCCHLNMSPWRWWMGAQDLTGRSTATIHCTATKGRTRNAHFLWQPRCSCFLTLYALSNVHWSLSCFQRHDHSLVFFCVFLHQFLTFFLPIYPFMLMYLISLFVFFFFFFYQITFLLFQEISASFLSHSLCIVSVMYTLIIFC